jgi:molecular chaperone HscC
MIVGIDLGTTHSLVAAWQKDEPRLIPNALGQFLTPSVVSINDTDEILVGLPARERLFTHPQHTAASFKRYMGTDHVVQLGKRSFRPEELSAFVLRSLKDDAEAFLGTSVSEAVITVPAYFNDRQRKATRIAGQLAGLTVERLVNEPTAAALAYGLHQRQHDSTFLVFDLGGGTFDVSILELFDGIMEVRATAGDTFLGGEDFVEALMEGFIECVARPAGVSHTVRDSQFYRLLRLQAEKAKRDLSLADTTTLSVPWQGSELTWTVSEEDFHELSQPLLTRLVAPVERALRDARICPAALDDVLLVGGATRMPIVRKLVTRLFERFPNVQLSPDEAVALGAAVQAGLKARDQALREVVLTDVCPYSLGVEVSKLLGQRQYRKGYFLPILERNVVVPASRVERLVTIVDQQTTMELRMYQGESRLVKDNVFLGAIQLAVPPKPAGAEEVEVRFTYDINGLLEVEATVCSTGHTHRLLIEQAPGVLSPEEIAERLRVLAALKIHPRDQAQNKATLARAERLYEEHLGDIRSTIGEWITTFETVLQRQDLQEINEVRKQLTALLDELDRHAYF